MEETAAGAGGGFVGGAIVGSGVGIIASGVAAGTTTASTAILGSSIVGAGGGVLGNTTKQFTENKLEGQTSIEAIANIDVNEQVTSGVIGAAVGTLSGGSVLFKQAANSSIQASQQQVADHVTKTVAPIVRQMASNDKVASRIITKISGEASKALAKNTVQPALETVVKVGAAEAAAIPIIENIANEKLDN